MRIAVTTQPDPLVTKEEALKNAGSEEITARHEWDVKNMPERTGYKTLTEAHDVLSRAYQSMPEALQQQYQEKQKQIKEFTALYTKALRDRIINSTETGETCPSVPKLRLKLLLVWLSIQYCWTVAGTMTVTLFESAPMNW